MRIFLTLLSFLIAIGSAQAERYTFGPKAGQEIPTEEELLDNRHQEEMARLGSIEELMKQNQSLLTKQNLLIEQQNQMLNQLYQLNYQSAVQQQTQQHMQLQQQYAPPAGVAPDAEVPIQVQPAQ